MLTSMRPSHAGDGAAIKDVLAVVRLCSPRDQSIKVLLHREEVRYSCWLCSRVMTGKYHSLGTSPYGKIMTLLIVSNKGFAHRLART
jgi:hypothetical protein